MKISKSKITKDYGDYCTILGNEAILRYLARGEHLLSSIASI